MNAMIRPCGSPGKRNAQHWVADMLCQSSDTGVQRQSVSSILIETCSSAEYFGLTGLATAGHSTRGTPTASVFSTSQAWAREGLIDLLTGDQWMSRQRTRDQLAEQARLSISQVAGTKVPVALEMAIFDGDLGKIARGLPAVRDADAEELALYQDTVLDDLTVQGENNVWRQLGKIVAPYQ